MPILQPSECPHGVIDDVCWECTNAPSRPEIASLHCFGTWQRYEGEGERGLRSHIQRLFEAFPHPRGASDGVGEGSPWLEHWTGGAFGIGVKRQAERCVDALRAHPAKRRVLTGFSRGAKVVTTVLEMLDAERRRALKDGRPAPPWTTIDVVVLLDYVDSTGLSGLLKYAGWLIDKIKPGRFAGWTERTFELPESCRWCLAIYALDEARPGFRHTMVTSKDAERLVVGAMRGVHGDIGGCGDVELGRDVGAIIRRQVTPRLGDAAALVQWRETWSADRMFETTTPDSPSRLLAGIPAWRRVEAPAISASNGAA